MIVNETKVKAFLTAIVNEAIESEAGEWPPKCSALLYQPVHPCALEKTAANCKPNEKV